MGHFEQARKAAISHLSAKFPALQGDPGIAQLAPGTLVDLVRMLGFRLTTLSKVGAGGGRPWCCSCACSVRGAPLSALRLHWARPGT